MNYNKMICERIMFILILFLIFLVIHFVEIYADPKVETESNGSKSFFISGHSLIDNPFVDYLMKITKSFRMEPEYNQQIVIGSSIRVRTRGNNPDSKDFSGYQLGKNREGSGMDILKELRSRSTIRSKQYDYLIITERHDLLSAVIWERTDKYLRHYRDQFVMNNNGRVYFFVPWLGIMDRKNVTSWIAYEKNALSAWECVVSRVNHDLVLEQSPLVYIIPANVALAELVERLISGSIVAEFGSRPDFDRLDWLFSDDVHLTKIGIYYIALVTYALIFDSSPENAWFPKEIDGKIAMNLQNVAWKFASYRSRSITDISLSRCSTLFTESFCNVYWDYVGQGQHTQSCRSHFARENKSNLFYSGAK
jgi:hypothetical protein